MGEFLFSIGYGGSLLIIGLCTRAFLRRMEQQATCAQQEMELEKKRENTDAAASYGKVGM
ncbi:hypothetical protein [Aneurinibacillus sp. REN35]|uniref:hypothetical protein n=1 Tax=Aneurinibacillus sp. REN35 TaxID=3237286 RepID=UPI003528780E